MLVQSDIADSEKAREASERKQTEDREPNEDFERLVQTMKTISKGKERAHRNWMSIFVYQISKFQVTECDESISQNDGLLTCFEICAIDGSSQN